MPHLGKLVCLRCGLFQLNAAWGEQCSCPDNTVGEERRQAKLLEEEKFQRWLKEVAEKPAEYADVLGDYGPVILDSGCGEPIAWGFSIVRRVGQERWDGLSKYGALECIRAGEWCLVTKWLTSNYAMKLYGSPNSEERGPRGGFRSIKYGDKLFVSRRMDVLWEAP
jgi:hypothetical protein